MEWRRLGRGRGGGVFKGEREGGGAVRGEGGDGTRDAVEKRVLKGCFNTPFWYKCRWYAGF